MNTLASPTRLTPSRRSLLRGVLGVGALTVGAPLLAACGSDDDSSSDGSSGSGSLAGSFQTGWVPTVEQAGTYVGDDKGYFAAAGLDLTILAGGPNTAVDSVVISGDAFVGNSNTDAVAEMIQNGAAVKVIAARFQKSPFCVYSLADKALTTPQELVGKKIGVAAANEAPFKTFLAINGVDVKDVTIVPVQFDPAPTANGEVDAQAGFSIDQPATLKAQGLDVHTMLFSDFGYSIYSSALFATTKTISERPDLLKAFLTGERKGWQGNYQDPAEGARLAVEVYGKDTGLDLAQQTLASEATKDLVVSDEVGPEEILALTDTMIGKNIDTLKQIGTDITADDLFDTSILESL
ncbi:ABC transporter substrate-binding protein [Nocardioides sp.]|uniref:ABC transporter substrate-binding protein n=1 Tax=Nocardioides sp. TaxID=35761 RepID=UPI0039E2D1C5